MRRLTVVSGGGTGIGYAVARTLAHDGDRVAIIGRRAEVLTAAAKTINTEVGAERVTGHPADLTEPSEVERVVGEFDGPVDVLVNNAGGGTSFGPKADLAAHAAAWQREFDANVLTAVLLTQALLPRMRRPGGRIILMSSIAALRGGAGAYSAVKAALHGWRMALAGDLGADGITVNVIAPGYVSETEFFGDRMTPRGHAARVDQTLVKRAGVPDDIAAAVRYLASGDAGYVTGQVLQVNGGALLGRG